MANVFAATPTENMTLVADAETEPQSVMNLPEDKTLLERIAAGDQSAVSECVDQYGGLVWTMARRMLPRESDAEDATQEIFIEIWEKADRFDPTKGNEATFIGVLTRRRLIDHLRRRSTARVAHLADVDPVEPNEMNIVETADEAQKAAQCFRKLSDRQQRVLSLSIYQGATHQAISDLLAVPLGTVKSFARRGLLQLRDCMKRNLLPGGAVE